MKLISKIALGVGSAGTVAGTGVLIGNYYSVSTIKQYIENNKKSKNKIFLAPDTDGLDAILTAYEGSKRTKPKDEKGNSIAKDKLAKWCEEAIKGKYYGADDKTFKGVESWCYINTKSFADRLKSNWNKKVSDKESTDKDWTAAWGKYKEGRDGAGLKITDKDRQTDLNGSEDVKGAKALSEWCNEKTKIKFYVDDAEAEFTRFDKWCPQVSAT